MKSIFYALSIIVIAAAAFFSFQVKSKMNAEIEKFNDTEAQNQQVAADIQSTENTLSNTKDALGKALDKKASLESQKGNEESKKRTHLAAIQQYDSEIAGYDAELEEIQASIDEIEQLVGGVGIDIDGIPAELENLKNNKLDLQKTLESLTDTESKLNREVASNRSEIDNLQSRMVDIRQKISRGAKVGTVTAVDPVWGFVIVNQGATNSNVTEDSDLLVSRGGRYLGRLEVTSLEPTQSICDIEEDSFRPGVRVQPGDSVILANPSAN